MKFGKEFKQQKVPEWTEAYVNYNGLKRILGDILRYKQSKQPATPLRALQHGLTLSRPFSGLNLQSSDPPNNGDIEDQVIDVNMLQQDGSGQFYKTKFLRQSEDGGETEVMFFRKLDEELNKVNIFYKDKVEEVMREAILLNKQMDALIALRIKVKNRDHDSSSFKTCHSTNVVRAAPLRSTIPSRDEILGREHADATVGLGTSNNYQQEESTVGPEVHLVNTPNCSIDCRDEANINNPEQDPLEILEHVKINNTLESPRSTIKGVLKDSKYEELSFKREELRKVEERLSIVFIEFYQKLRLLKHYSFINLSAFSKIMKKYEKITSRKASRSYMKIVDNSYLGSSDEHQGDVDLSGPVIFSYVVCWVQHTRTEFRVTSLLERVEATFIKHFSNSNRREGMKSLRPKAKREKHSVTFFSGFFSGCSIALVIAIVLRIEALKQMEKENGTSYMVNIFPLYSLFAYIVLHMLIYAANIYFWRRYRVNYSFIFGFKQGTQLGYREVFLLSTGLALLVLASFLANLQLELCSRNQFYKTMTELVPLGLVIVVLLIIFWPFDIIYRSSRFFFVQCIIHCICAPLYKVTLPDFFLADQLTSQVQAIRSLELYICHYGLGEFSLRQKKCHSHGAYNAFYFIVAVIPYWLRFLQCLRRLCEDKDPVHGYNSLKYFLTIVAVLIRTAFELRRGLTWMVLALVSSAVATIMNTYWDIVIDWGLLRTQSKNFCLRDKLLVSHKSVYFVAMILNVVLRLTWVQMVLEFNLPSLRKMTITTIISCLEIIRRGIWSFFRLENEHLNNVGKYRAFKSVPLPFNYSSEDIGDEDSGDEGTDKDD